MRKAIITTLAVLLHLSWAIVSSAQTDTASAERKNVHRFEKRETAYRLLIGYQVQQAFKPNKEEYGRKYVEIGLHKSMIDWGYHGPVTFTHGPSIEFAPGNKTIWGLKYGAWTSYLFAIGFSAVYYTDFNYGNFKLRPEFGFGANYFRITGGYNIPTFWNKDFRELRQSRGQLSISVIPFKIKTIKETRPTRYM